jgi:hypothetical protein
VNRSTFSKRGQNFFAIQVFTKVALTQNIISTASSDNREFIIHNFLFAEFGESEEQHATSKTKSKIPNYKRQITNKSQQPKLKLPAVELRGIFSVEYDFILSSVATPAAALYATIKDKAARNALAKHFQMTKTNSMLNILVINKLKF